MLIKNCKPILLVLLLIYSFEIIKFKDNRWDTPNNLHNESFPYLYFRSFNSTQKN